MAAATLASATAKKLTDIIESGKFAPGQKLPPEHVLTQELNVSRSVLREAVATLRNEGLLTSRRGSGVFVASNNGMRPFRIDSQDLAAIPDLIGVLELRSAVEMEAAGIAARRRSLADMQAIEAAQRRIEEATERGADSVEADFEFHMAIARATQNVNFSRFVEYLGTKLIPRQQVRIQSDPIAGESAFLQMIIREHRDIEQAIRVGDAVGARDAMRRHLIDGAIGRYELWARQSQAPTQPA